MEDWHTDPIKHPDPKMKATAKRKTRQDRTKGEVQREELIKKFEKEEITIKD